MDHLSGVEMSIYMLLHLSLCIHFMAPFHCPLCYFKRGSCPDELHGGSKHFFSIKSAQLHHPPSSALWIPNPNHNFCTTEKTFQLFSDKHTYQVENVTSSNFFVEIQWNNTSTFCYSLAANKETNLANKGLLFLPIFGCLHLQIK